MREVRITKEQFDEFLFPFVSGSSPESDNERECALRVMRKLKDPEITEEEALSPAQLEAAERRKRKIWPGRRLACPEATFHFQEDEHRLILKRLKEATKGIAMLVIEEYTAFLDAFEGAKEVRDGPKVVKEADAATG